MWACDKHLKKVLTLLDTPHISKARCSVKCSLCDNRAIVKIYYTHRAFQFKDISLLEDTHNQPV